jgi:hypothetical protein
LGITYRVPLKLARRTTFAPQRGAGVQDQTAEYEIGSSGTLELHSQKMRTSAKHADGSETEVVDSFGQSVPGIAGTSDSGLKLKERETIERTVAPDSSIHETSRVQRPMVSDAKVLGPATVVAEVVCRGSAASSRTRSIKLLSNCMDFYRSMGIRGEHFDRIQTIRLSPSWPLRTRTARAC